MNELLKYIQSIKLKDWDLEEKTWGYWLVNQDREICLILINDYEKSLKKDNPIENHSYASRHLQSLILLIEKLDIFDFEVIKNPKYTLALKTEFFYIIISTLIYIEELKKE